MKLSISSINDILKEGYCKYEDRTAEEYKAYMDGVTDILNFVVLELEREPDNSRSEQATI